MILYIAGARIVVLDEATSAIDVTTDAMVQRVVAEHFKDCTLLVSETPSLTSHVIIPMTLMTCIGALGGCGTVYLGVVLRR